MIDVYIETGQKLTFAGALEWPGWCRGRAGEDAALQALLQYGPRYAQVLEPAGIAFEPPGDVAGFNVVERLAGNSTTDFGAPGQAPAFDANPPDDVELARLQGIVRACWHVFDRAVEAAAGKELRKGPRGGGRDRDAIARHVLEADGGYLSQLGWKFQPDQTAPVAEQLAATRQAILDGLVASARGQIPSQGPRGGKRWSARYFTRRLAWHVLDHAWELEDRSP